MRIVARVTILTVVCWLPFVLLTLAGRRNDGAGMVLVLPFFFAPPIALSAVMVFAPIERYLEGRGVAHLKNVGVPLLGAVAVALLAVAWLMALDALDRNAIKAPNARTLGERVPEMLLLGGTLGAVGGTLWRLTDWAATLLRLRGGA